MIYVVRVKDGKFIVKKKAADPASIVGKALGDYDSFNEVCVVIAKERNLIK